MRKIQEFARECGVTDRAILKHIKKYETELSGHIERRGGNGTWIDETAEEIIRSRMIKHPMIVNDAVNFAEENATLMKKNSELLQMVTSLQQRVIDLQEENSHMLLDAKDRQLALEAASTQREELRGQLDQTKAQLDATQEALAGAQAEAQSYKRSIFGFYRKKG